MPNDPFRTPVEIEKADVPVSTTSGVMFMGSCFAENIGKYMLNARWKVMINPFGVVYNPLSVAGAFESILENKRIQESDLYYLNGLWHSFQHHGKFSNPDAEATALSINETTLKSHLFLENTEFLFITFGTAFVYEHKELRNIVANCHKFPGDHFNRYLLDTEEIIDTWKELIVRLRVYNPSIKIIFTLSPVRHLKDGAHGNQISKAILLLAIEKLTSLFDKAWYFPAYEIVLDELRDYRFYDEGMVQPDNIAVEYIWKRFCETQMTVEAQKYYKEVQKVIKAREHRPSGHITPDYTIFLRGTLDLLNSLAMRYPAALLQDDIILFEERLRIIS
jgi:hypothetical protein